MAIGNQFRHFSKLAMHNDTVWGLLTFTSLQDEGNPSPTIVVNSEHNFTESRRLGLLVLDTLVVEVARLVAVSGVLAQDSFVVLDGLDRLEDLDLYSGVNPALRYSRGAKDALVIPFHHECGLLPRTRACP